VEALDEQVARHDLEHEPRARLEHAADLPERPRVLLVAEVAERGEQVQRRVEAVVRERQLAVVGLDQLRPARARRPAARLVEKRRRAVDAGDAEAGAGQLDRVTAEAARDVDQLAALRAAREPGGGERLVAGALLALPAYARR